MTLLAMTPVRDMERPYTKRWAALSVLCLSLLVVVMANTSLLVAAPSMTLDLQLTSSDLQWVIDGYTVPYAALMLLFGVIGDRYSRRGALLIGLLVFTAGSIAGALTEAAIGVILARIVMGVAAAIVMPATLSLLVATFPKRERATAVTIWAATSGLAIALGPLLAGLLLEHYWWGSSFLLNVPITLVAIAAAVVVVPPSRALDPGRIDWLGGVLSVLTVSAIVYSIIEGTHFGWSVGPTYFAAVGLLGGVAFVAWEFRHPTPLLDIRAFRSRVLSGAVLAVLLFFLVTFGAIYYVAQYFQFVLDFGPVSTGVHLLPLAIAVFVGSGMTQWLTPRYGMKYTVTSGMVLGTLAVVSMIGIDTTATYVNFLPVLVLLGLAIGLSVSPCTDAIMAEFPDDKLGVAGGLNDTALELGGSLGIAILGSVLATTYRGGIVDFLAGFPGKTPSGEPTAQAAQAIEASGDSVAGAVIVADILRDNAFLTGYADSLQANAIAAYAAAVEHTSLIATVMFGIGAVVVAVLLPSPPKREPVAVQEEAAQEVAAQEVAKREVDALERLLEQPSAQKPPVARASEAIVDEELSRPSIYQLAAKVIELEAAEKNEAAFDVGGRITIHQLALADIARNRRRLAEEELDAALDLAELPVRLSAVHRPAAGRPAAGRPLKPAGPTLQNFYHYGDSAHRRCSEFQERSSSIWAMPL
ncbi:MFS transporter [Rhodococcoides yunnanense]|uniref:MFS transporter n=1 Tax=Rhodococcoides yunnanense TaxID=278209 RepID=UPI000A00959D|nr:MFS transporter [Rhodococcus yunnanensis]